MSNCKPVSIIIENLTTSINTECVYVRSGINFNEKSITAVSVLENGGGNENKNIRPNQIFEFDANTWGLLYFAESTTKREGVKYATAPKSDPHNWTKEGSLILPSGTVGQWDEFIGSSCIIKIGSTWYMFYDSFLDGRIGIASGPDLASITKNVSNPIIDNTASADFNKWIRHPSVILKDSTLHMFYEGRNVAPNLIENAKLGTATANISDLTSWTLSSTPIVDNSAYNWNRQQVNSMSIKIGDRYFIFFGATSVNSGSQWTCGGGGSYYYSDDLITWNIYNDTSWLWYIYSNGNEYGRNSVQEVTPYYQNDTLNIYFWGQDQNIGRFELPQGSFANTLPPFTFSDDFEDGTLGPNWTKTEQSGITLNESGGVINIVADGVGSATDFPVILELTGFTVNTYDNPSVAFKITRTPQFGGDALIFELSNAALTNAFRFLKSNFSNNIRINILKNSSVIFDDDVPWLNGERLMMTINRTASSITFWKENGTFWDIVGQTFTANFISEDMTFKVRVNNTIGQSATLDDFVLWPYEHQNVSTYIL